MKEVCEVYTFPLDTFNHPMKNPDWEEAFITEAYMSLGKYLPEKNKFSSKY